MIEIITTSEIETFEIGKKIAKILQKGDIICLTGDLGAGKTTITKSIAKYFSVEEYITSPTFTIVNEYNGAIKINHFDVYRVEEIEEMYEIGYEEYFFSDAICIIEWANLIEEIIPDNSLWIDIRRGEKDNERLFFISTKSDSLKERLEGVSFENISN